MYIKRQEAKKEIDHCFSSSSSSIRQLRNPSLMAAFLLKMMQKHFTPTSTTQLIPANSLTKITNINPNSITTTQILTSTAPITGWKRLFSRSVKDLYPHQGGTKGAFGNQKNWYPKNHLFYGRERHHPSTARFIKRTKRKVLVAYYKANKGSKPTEGKQMRRGGKKERKRQAREKKDGGSGLETAAAEDGGAAGREEEED